MSVAIGAAQAKKLDADPRLVYVLMGDGECQEGQVWEAALYAAHHRVDNLIASIDLNYKQIDGDTRQVMNTTSLATLALYEHDGPAYLRFGRPKWPIFTEAQDPSFQLGKAQILRAGTDVTVIANGHLVWKALLAADALQQRGISAEVINLHTVTPLDAETLLASAAKTRAVVTAEEHQRHGGLADLVGQLLSTHLPTPLRAVAVQDQFGESGTPDQLLVKYGLDTPHIVQAAESVLKA
ncbi:MAG: transketolase C-terminal domain-containing protein [bacterium]